MTEQEETILYLRRRDRERQDEFVRLNNELMATRAELLGEMWHCTKCNDFHRQANGICPKCGSAEHTQKLARKELAERLLHNQLYKRFEPVGPDLAHPGWGYALGDYYARPRCNLFWMEKYGMQHRYWVVDAREYSDTNPTCDPRTVVIVPNAEEAMRILILLNGPRPMKWWFPRVRE